MSWEHVSEVLELWNRYAAWICFSVAAVLAVLLRLAANIWAKVQPTAQLTLWVVEGLRLLAWLVLLSGLALGMRLSDWPSTLQESAVPVLIALAIFLVARATVRATVAALQRHWTRWFPTRPATTVINTVVALAVYTVALLMILHQFGLSITPLLTAVGVGGLAVALGVQDTLNNLFAAISITLAGLIRPGDYLRLENGQEGTVLDIGWRYTTLRTPQHTLIVIPNQRLSQLIVTNFSLPDTRTLVQLQLTLPKTNEPKTQLETFERLFPLVVAELPAVLTEPPPTWQIVRVTDKGELEVRIQYWLSDPYSQSASIHAIYRRLTELGIVPLAKPNTAL